ncbi:MAG TPA: hypothetical protein VII68_11770 [Casimicrobiaceae bacterium]
MAMRNQGAGRAVGAAFVAAALALAADASAQGGRMQFRTHAITDPQQGNLTVATIAVPVQWRVSQSVHWNYQDVSNPLHIFARAESPDGSAWVEFFPAEIFYWLQPVPAPVAFGARNAGLIHAPNIGARQALEQFVVRPYRGKQPQMRVVNARPVDAGRLAEAFNQPAIRGEGAGMRIAYALNGRPVEEDVYAMLGAVNSIPYTGRQGTWYENQRTLLFAHALGAAAGTLDSAYPLLTYIVGSIRIDPQWEQHRQKIMQALVAEFGRQMQAGADRINAAGAASRAISANNDAMLSSMQFQRQASAQRDQAMRAASASASSSGDGFSSYMRGTEKMQDPYWGTSDRSYLNKYHWTDGSGNYRSSNDSTFNPNVGTGGGVTWQRMEPAR